VKQLGDTAIKNCLDNINITAEIAESHGFENLLFGRDWLHADMKMRQGDFDAAEKLLAGASQWLSLQRPLDTVQYYFKRAHLALRRGDLFAALKLIQEAQQSGAKAKIPGSLVSTHYWNESVIRIKLGDYASAYIAAARGMEYANPNILPLYQIALAGYHALETLSHDDVDSIEVSAKLSTFFLALREKNTYSVFTLLPIELAKLCAAALSFNIESAYVVALITHRQLLAPMGAPALWPFPIRIRLLGQFQLEIAGEVYKGVGKTQKKPLEMLHALVAFSGQHQNSGQGVSAQRMMDLLWPSLDAENPKTNLDTTLFRLRKLLSVENAILFSDGILTLNPALVWTDINRIQHLLATTVNATNCRQLAREFLSLYRGALLAGDTEPDWILLPREQLVVKQSQFVTTIADALREAQADDEALALYAHGLTQDELVEAFYIGQMQIYIDRQEPSEAIRVYRRCKQTYSIVLGLKPSSAIENERARIHTPSS
jgi:DNA-binding SARP family transcriptional activator